MIKYGIISVLTAVFIFSGGVFYGYNSASSFYLSGSDSKPLLLPVKAAVADQVREPKLPETIVAGAEIDVDQPDPVSQNDGGVGNNSGTSLGKSTRPLSIEQARKNTGQDMVAANADGKDDKAVVIGAKAKEIEKSSAKIKQVKLQAGDREPDKSADQRMKLKFTDISRMTADELDSIKYSVQVGMYGRLANAENMVKQLQTKDFDAYVSGFTNKNNETRYNVRFGYFQDRLAAKSALKQYRQSQQADGYLVKFTADSVAGQGSNSLVKNRQPAGYDLNEYDLNEDKTEPAPAELKSADDKLSRADNLDIGNMIKVRGKLDHTETVTN